MNRRSFIGAIAAPLAATTRSDASTPAPSRTTTPTGPALLLTPRLHLTTEK